MDEDVSAQFARLGVNIPADVAEEVGEVWDLNWPSVLLFLDLETQWRCVSRGMGGVLHWLGLDYSAAGVVLSTRSRGAQRRHPASRVLDDLRVMEREALTIMNEAAE